MTVVADRTEPAASAAAREPSTAGSAPATIFWRRLFNEPLVHFLAVAALLVAAERFYAFQHDRYRIVMTPDRVAQLVASYKLQFGIDAGPELREVLVQKDFENEVLYRQALALGMDKDDEMIRRRLIQKMEFVTDDRNAPPEPTVAQMQAYFRAHREKYGKPQTATFTHVFFSADRGGDVAAKARAAAVRNRLNRDHALRAPTAGDAFPDNYDFSAYEPIQVSRLFGETEFSSAVFVAPVGQWAGPYRSAYGWHLIRVDARKPALTPSFAEVRDRVHGDFLAQEAEAANKGAMAKMKGQYRLIRADQRPGR